MSGPTHVRMNLRNMEFPLKRLAFLRKEIKKLPTKGGGLLEEGSRLGCAATIHGDVVVDIPEESQVHSAVVRKKEIDLGEVVLDPVLKLFS